jgi:hypothetical protein
MGKFNILIQNLHNLWLKEQNSDLSLYLTKNHAEKKGMDVMLHVFLIWQ